MLIRLTRSLLPLALVACAAEPPAEPTVWDRMADRIALSVDVQPGERVVLRFDPVALPELLHVLHARLEVDGAEVALLPYGEVDDFDAVLAETDVYIWLPDSLGDGTSAAQRARLGAWLDAGRGRQIHFHWGAGTSGADGLPGVHDQAYHDVYVGALDIDYDALDRRQDSAIALLRSGPIRVTTPAGTDITFEVGDRPFNQQNGDASRERMQSAVTRIDREIELPAGVIRVAPLEETVNGVVVVPEARFPDGDATGVRMAFAAGQMTELSAATGEEAARAFVESGDALRHFRELGIGFNPELQPPPGGEWLPYFGYGDGVVRLSLGNNAEVGGAVTGNGVRWFFFPDATVSVGDVVLVDGGRPARE